MRKFIGILVLCLLGVALYFYTGSKMQENNDKIPITAYNKIMSYDLDKEYPDSIDQVLNLNNRIIKYIYGQQEDKEDNLENIIIQQRKLFDDELLEQNSLDIMLENVKKEIEIYESLNKTILGSKMLLPEKIENNSNDEQELSKVKVVYYTNTDNNIYLVYGLRKTNDKWKILGWKPTKEFVTEE